MAKSKATASSIAIHSTTFARRDVELIIAAIGSTKSGLNPNIELFASLGQFESPALAQQAWDTVRRKYGAVIDALTGEEGDEEEAAAVEGEAEEEVLVKPMPKSAVRKKPIKSALKPGAPVVEEGDNGLRRSTRGAAAESDDKTSPARKPAKTPVKRGRAAKPAKRTVYAGADEPESEPEAEVARPAVVVDERAGAEAAAAMKEDEDNDEEDDEAEEVDSQAPAKERGRPAKKAKGKVKTAKKTADVEAEEDNALSAYENALVGMKGGK
nr:hypothetical protein B0A51_14359 [Rachicladosporium sp. CCFEE 5018]